MFLVRLLSAIATPTGQPFDCAPIHMWDGDGPVGCEEGPRIRLAGKAARELDGSCSQSHLCPAADPIAARDALVTLLGCATGVGPHGHILIEGPMMRCVFTDSAGYKRTDA